MFHNRSEQLNELFSAMAKAQGEMPVAGHNSENPHFRSSFADMTEMVRVSRPSLTKYGLAVSQQIYPEADGSHYLITNLCHASGQWIESRIKISPDKGDIQSLGKYITYLKRYSYGALVGVVSSGEDDDGESLVRDNRNNGNSQIYQSTPKPDLITKEQLEQLDYELRDHMDIVANLLDKYKINSLRDIPKASFMSIITRVREIKATKER